MGGEETLLEQAECWGGSIQCPTLIPKDAYISRWLSENVPRTDKMKPLHDALEKEKVQSKMSPTALHRLIENECLAVWRNGDDFLILLQNGKCECGPSFPKKMVQDISDKGDPTYNAASLALLILLPQFVHSKYKTLNVTPSVRFLLNIQLFPGMRNFHVDEEGGDFRASKLPIEVALECSEIPPSEVHLQPLDWTTAVLVSGKQGVTWANKSQAQKMMATYTQQIPGAEILAWLQDERNFRPAKSAPASSE
jgi:hypothetical protein